MNKIRKILDDVYIAGVAKGRNPLIVSTYKNVNKAFQDFKKAIETMLQSVKELKK